MLACQKANKAGGSPKSPVKHPDHFGFIHKWKAKGLQAKYENLF